MLSVISLTCTRLRVLLVEDNSNDAELIAKLFLETPSAQKCELTRVAIALDAIELLKTESFDAILLTIPRTDRPVIDPLFRIKNYSKNSPIVVLSDRADEKLALRMIESGAQDYLVKTKINSEILIRSLHYAIERQKWQEALRQSEEKYAAIAKSVINSHKDNDHNFPSCTCCGEAGHDTDFPTEPLLPATAEFWQNAFNAIADPIFIKDEQHRFIFVNDALCQVLNCSRAELIGRADSEVLSAGEIACFCEKDSRTLAAERGNESEETLTDVRGERRIFSTKISFFENSNGQKFFIATSRDISEHKRREAALLERGMRFRQLAENLPGMIYQFQLSSEGEMSLPYVSSGCREVYEIEPEEFQKNLSSFQGVHPDDVAGLNESIATSARTLLPWKLEWRQIMPSGKVKWLQGGSKPEKQANGDIIWDGLVMDITELRQAQQERDRFFTLSPDLLCIAGFDGYLKRVNPAWTATLGHTKAELLAKPFIELVHPHDRAATLAEMQRLKTGVLTINFENRFLCQDGSYKWFSWTAVPSATEGLIYAAGRDISDRKLSELALNRITRAVDSTSDAIAITDWKGRSIYHNRAFVEQYGYAVEELNRGGGPAVLHPKLKLLKEIFTTLRKGRSWSGEVELKTKRGSLVQTQVRADCIKDSAGKPIGMIAVLTDLTELKQTEAALRLSEQRLQLAIQGSDLGLWDWNIATGETYFDAQWKRMLGYETGDIESTYETWKRLVHPEELPRALQALTDHLEGKTDLYELEFRMLTKSEEWKWILAVGKIVERSESGAPLRMTGTHKDISARIAAEAEKERANASLKDLAQKLQEAQRIAHIGSWEFEVSSGTITWSDELFRIWGLEPGSPPSFEELIATIHPEDRMLFLQAVQRAMTEGKPYEFDQRIYRPDGEIRYVNARSEALLSESGQVVRLLGTGMDITDRKRAIEALKDSEQRFRAIFENAAIGIAQVLPNGKFLKVNPGFCNIVGYSPSELKERIFAEITHPDDLEINLRYNRQLLAGQIQHYSIEKRYICQSGEAVWANLTASLVRAPSGEPKYIVKIVEDISDRKAAEEALRQQFKREQLVVGILERIRSSLNPEEVLNTAVEQVRQFLQNDRTAIYRLNPDGSGVVTVESVGKGWMPIKGFEIRDNCFAQKYVPLYQAGRIRAMADIHNSGLSDCHIQILEQLQIKANLTLPILQNERLWGLLVVNQCGGAREWQEFEIECLKQISVQLAIAIQQSTLFEQAKTEITDRKQAEQALRESEARERSKALQLEMALQKLKNTQTHLVQQEKMASLGQMVAGIAHEINNPVSFIYGNLNPANQYASALLHLIALYRQHYPHPHPDIQAEIEAIDLEYISDDLPKLLKSLKVGAERIREIVKSLRTFSRLDEAEKKSVDIHEGIESTLMILQHRLKPNGRLSGIQIVKHYEPLPQVECYAGQLNQVFLNIVANAIDALEERDEKRAREAIAPAPSTITIRTYLAKDGSIGIAIADNGPGMPETVRKRLFDPFFTTKPVGKGTGLGLSISHSIVVERHGGRLCCTSTLGQGTEFVIEIPQKL